MNARDLYKALLAEFGDKMAPPDEVASSRLAALRQLGTAMARGRGLPGTTEAFELLEEQAARITRGEDISERRLQAAWESVKPSLLAWDPEFDKRGDISIRTLRTRTAVALTTLTDDGALITVDDALHDLLYNNLKLGLSAWELVDTGPRATPEPHVLSEPIELAARLARIPQGHLRWFGELWLPVRVDLSAPATDMAFLCIEAAERFLLAHEFAHVRLGHLNPAAVNEEDAPTSGIELNEHLADIFALHVLISPDASRRIDLGFNFQIPLLGIEFFWITLTQFESVYFVSGRAAHPAPSKRRGLLVEHLREILGGELPEGVTDVFAISAALHEGISRFDPQPRPLLELLRNSETFSLSHAYDEEDLEMLVGLDGRERFWTRPILNIMGRLGQLTNSAGTLSSPPRLVQIQLAREFEELGLDENVDCELFKRQWITWLAGEHYFLERLPRQLGIDAFVSLMSPGTMEYRSWIETYFESVPESVRLHVMRAAEYYIRKEPLRQVVPGSDSLKTVVADWLLDESGTAAGSVDS